MKYFLSALLLLTPFPLLAECMRPEAPILPDGAAADLQTMIDSQKAVKEYVAGTEEYLECLAIEEAADGSGGEEEMDPAVLEERIEMHNSAVDEMEQVAADFNVEIRKYKAKSE